MRRILTIFILFLAVNGFSQTFKSGLLFGVSAAQVEGDGYGGYNKAGAILGGFTNTEFSKKISMQFEIAYIGKGARKVPKPDKGDLRSFNLRLNYIEIPLALRYHFKKFHFELGLYYGYLLNIKAEDQFGEIDFQNQPYPFKKHDFGGLIGLQYEFIHNWFFNVRSKNSLIPIRDFLNYDQNIGILNKTFNRGWYNVDLNFTVRYQFGAKN